MSVVQYAKARGSAPTGVRDAVHEAAHALRMNAGDNWDREYIHSRIMRLDPGGRAQEECVARAVEREVCKKLGVEYDLEEYLFISVQEAITWARISMPLSAWRQGIENASKSVEVQVLTASIVEL